MSAVSNLNLLATPLASRKKQQKQEKTEASLLLVPADDDALSVLPLPDSMLEIATQTFKYIDDLRLAAESLENKVEDSVRHDNVDAQLISARTTARTVSAEAVKLGVTTQDYIGTKLEVSEDSLDPEDPFSGGGSDALPRVASSGEIEPPEENAEETLAQHEVEQLMQAAKADHTKGREDEAGVREPAVVMPASTKVKEVLEPAPEILKVDGMEVVPQIVEGLQDGENYEQMLLRVQKVALAQLDAEASLGQENESTEGKDSKESGNKVSFAAESASACDTPNLRDGGGTTPPPQKGSYNQEINANSEILTDVPAKELSAEPVANSAKLHKNLAQDIDENPNPITSDSKSAPLVIEVLELQDPFSDSLETKELKVKLGSSWQESENFAHSLGAQNSKATPQEPQEDVVGALLREQIFEGKRVEPPALDGDTVVIKTTTSNVSSDSASEEIPVSDESFFEPDPSYFEQDLGDYDEDEDHIPSETKTFKEEIPESEPLDDAKAEIEVLADGRTDDVPVAQRLERERIEQADMIAAGRALGPDDFIAEVASKDDWALDFVAAGYREGAVYSALCASVRREDPSDHDRWIVVMSDNFRLFAMDPNFTQGLIERFSALKKRHIEISLQLVAEIPKGSVKELSGKAFLKACDQARALLESMPGVQRIASLAGADLRHCPLRLMELKQEKTEP